MRRKTKLIVLNTGFARIEAYDSSSVVNTYSVTVLIPAKQKLRLSKSATQKCFFFN
jgi:hypothetical protein